jgi:hypothetical protein
LGSKIGKHLQLCGRARYRATTQNLESRTQLDETVESASGADPLLLYKILHLQYIRLLIKFSVFHFRTEISEVFTAETVEITVFREMTSCRLVYYRCANIPIYTVHFAEGLNISIQQEIGTNIYREWITAGLKHKI